MKDAQRQKVYNAESAYERSHGDAISVTLAEAQEWLDMLAKEFQVQPVTIQRNARIKRWGGWYIGWARVIEVPRSTTTLKTVLHEFAHHLEKESVRDVTWNMRTYVDPGHGGTFTEMQLKVQEAVYGPEAAADLAKAYQERGVTIGTQAAAEAAETAAQRTERRHARNMERNGELGDVYMVRYFSKSFEDEVYVADGRFIDRSPWGAKVWRTEAAARKAAKGKHSRATSVSIIKAGGRFTCSWRGESGAWTYNGTDLDVVETYQP